MLEQKKNSNNKTTRKCTFERNTNIQTKQKQVNERKTDILETYLTFNDCRLKIVSKRQTINVELFQNAMTETMIKEIA